MCFALVSRSPAPIFGCMRISLFLRAFWFLRESRSLFSCSYRYLPKLRILQTGGFALGDTSTRSRFLSFANSSASRVEIIFTSLFSPSPSIKRTSRTRICSLILKPLMSANVPPSVLQNTCINKSLHNSKF